MLTQLQKLIILLACALSFNLKAQVLVNPNATSEAIKLKTLLDSVYGKKIISGHMNDVYYDYIVQATGGKSPAIMGYDFNGICPSQGGNNDAQKAIKWVKEKGGIAQFQWHWISPDANGDFYTKNFKLSWALKDTINQSYKNIIRDIDLVAVEMKKMQDVGVPILWRPLHEAEGAWFWWGMSKGDTCKMLWNLMYDRLVNFHKLNNLIWIWNSYGTTKQNWYPGDSTVDIIAWDYPDYAANTGSWSQYQKLFGDKGKLFGIGEDGKLTNPDLFDSQPWLYFLTWDYMILEPSAHKDGKNTKDWLYKVYNDSRVLTLDDLTPGPKAYAGKSSLYFDYDGNGIEEVQLDGSASYNNDGTITSYIWTENNIELASGVSPRVELPIGEHKIVLTITTSANETKSSTVVINVKKPSLSLNKSFKVSSTEPGLGNNAINAIDGIESTRWSSAYSDPQWFQIDLEKPYNISNVVINWEAASAKNYDIEQSNDEKNWTTVVSKTNMKSGARVDSLNNLPGGARYIRVFGTNRNTNYGYSFYEFEVYGAENPDALPVGTPSTNGTTSVKKVEKNNFSIYPSELNQNEMLHIDSKLKNASIQIINIQGLVLKGFELKNTSAIVETSGFHKGLYFIKVSSANQVFVKKFIIQ